MNIDRTRTSLFGSTALVGLARLALIGATTGALAWSSAASAQELPTGGSVAAGSAVITTGGVAVTIDQASAAVAINWDGFSIGQGKGVRFNQPDANAVALNRVTGADPSVILGNLSANGKVFLVNPNGVLFGQGAQVDVGGLVASTLDIGDADFMAGKYRFAGPSGAAVLNRGTIAAADGGYVALLGADVGNRGLIAARLGTVALAAGQGVTLDVAGDGLLNVTVDTGAVAGLASNGGLIRADGGRVLLTAQAAGQLLRTVVNNTGVIEARTIASRAGRIVLLGDMGSGTANVSGVLDASAPTGGDGGFIETSAATVDVADAVSVTTAAPGGVTGTWLIDPADFTIAPSGGNISGATLSAQLVTNSIVISTLAPDATGGNGDIFVNDAVAWSASGAPTTLTMNASRDVDINAAITATNGNVVVCCGRDVNVNAAMTTTNGSILLNAGRDVRVYHALTTVDGNIALCAGHDVHIDAAVTLTRGSTIPAQSLGLPVGLTLIAGGDGTGAGTIIFAALAPPVTVTVAPVTLNYLPASYAAPQDFSTRFVLTEGASLTQRMLLFPNGDKVFDGSANTILSGFDTMAAGAPSGVTLIAGPGATAAFASAAAGPGGITYSGYTLAGADADRYALAGSCCVATFATFGTIAAAPVVTPPVVVPPVGEPVPVPPAEAPPVAVPPVVTPPAGQPVPTPPAEAPPAVVPPVGEPVPAPPVEGPPPVATPPVATPPVAVPPVATPPVVVPPAVTPASDVPPVATPPVAAAPVVVPPVVTQPDVVPVVPAVPVIPASATAASTSIYANVAAATGLPMAAPQIPQLTLVAEGVRAPGAQLSSLARPAVQVAEDDRPIGRAGSERAGSAFLPAPAVPVYPPKQARH